MSHRTRTRETWALLPRRFEAKVKQLLCRKGKGSGRCAILLVDFLHVVLTRDTPESACLQILSRPQRETPAAALGTLDTGHLP